MNYKLINRKRRGDIRKGHATSTEICTAGNKNSITIFNSYFDMHISETCEIDTHSYHGAIEIPFEYKFELHKHMPGTQYLLKMLGNKMIQLNGHVINVLGNNYELRYSASCHQRFFQMHCASQGLMNFKTAQEHVEIIKAVNPIFSFINARIKSLTKKNINDVFTNFDETTATYLMSPEFLGNELNKNSLEIEKILVSVTDDLPF